MTITYQQAKRIRKTGLLGLFADQLMYEKKVGTALGKAISLKTRGTIMGLTQFMDPLNIAKVLTFGSALGPALLGHFMKRDPRDVQYFTGRLKPIHERTTGEKLTKLSGRGTGTENMDVVLRKMYKLMAATHEQNIKRFEMAKNREEEIKLEEDRRHKELLKALSSIGGGKITKVGKTTGGEESLLDKIKPILAMMVKKAIDIAMKAYEWIKDLLKWIGKDSKFKDFLEFSPLARLAIGLELLTFSSDVGAGSDKVPVFDANAPENRFNPYAIMQKGEAKTSFEAFQKIRQYKNDAAPDREEISQAASMLNDVESTNIYGVTRKQLFQWLDNHKSPDSKFTIIKNQNNINQGDLTENIPSAPTAPPVMSAPKMSEKLDRTQDENLKGRVAYGVLKNTPSITTINKSNVNQQIDKTVPIKRSLPSVRNNELEFQNRIFSNTRVAN